MTDQTLFRILVGVLFVAAITISGFFRRRAASSGERISRREEGWLIMVPLRLLGLSGWAVLIAYVINPAWVAWSSAPVPVWARWSGVALALSFLPLVYWVFSSLGRNVTDTVVTRREHTLVTSGPYRWVRHPLYTIAGIFFMGLSLAAANWLMALLMSAGIVMLALRTPSEEERLIVRFGNDYREYMGRTGRYIPRLFLKRDVDSLMQEGGR